jgi:hypothetical protein
MDREFFEKIYEKNVEKRLLKKADKKEFYEFGPRFRTPNLDSDPEVIEDIFLQFYVWFFLMLKQLDSSDFEDILDFINFPEDTKIIINKEIDEETVSAEIDRAMSLSREYFSSNIDDFYADVMMSFIEETQIRILFMLSKIGSCFTLKNTSGKIFEHMVKLHRRFANERMKMPEERGSGKKWSSEKRKKILDRFNEFKIIIGKAGASHTNLGYTKRKKFLMEDFPELPEIVIERIMDKNQSRQIENMAIDALTAELSGWEHFRIKSERYVENIIKKAKKEQRDEAA